MSHSPPSRFEQLALVVAVCAAVAAFGSAYNQPAVWLCWLPAVVSVFWRLEQVHPRVHRAFRYLAWTLLGVAAALGIILMAYAVLLPEAVLKGLAFAVGYGLVFFTAAFVLGTPAWRPEHTLIPVTIALAVVASFNSLAKITPLLMAPGAALFVYLLISRRDISWRQITPRLVLFAAASALLAWAFYAGLPRLQTRVEAATFLIFSSEGSEGAASLQSRLGDLEKLKLSKRVVLRAWTRQPQKLRRRIFARFDGQTWHARVTPAKLLTPAPADSTEKWLSEVPGNSFLLPGTNTQVLPDGLVETRIVQSVLLPGVLVSSANKLLVRAPVASLSADDSENLAMPLSSEVHVYGFVNLKSAPHQHGDYRPDNDYLALPQDLDPRWRPLAQQLAAGTASDEERVEKTVKYVQGAAEYSLDVGKFHSQQPVTEFFFEKKRGYCQYFASAAAILLRMQDVPARYVAGYNMQEFNRAGGHFVVREADAHAWLEVFVAEKGWVEADPTPEAEFEARRAAAGGWLEQSGEWLAGVAAELWSYVRLADWRGAAASLRRALGPVASGRGATVGAILLLLVWMTRLWRRGRLGFLRHKPEPSPAHAPVAPELARVVETLRRCWEEAGFPQPASRGLLEHLETIPPEKLAPELRTLSQRLAGEYYRASFGPKKFSAEELREMDALRSELARGLRRTDG